MASVFKKLGSGDWQIEYTDHAGRRHRRSSGTTDKRAAEQAATQLEADVAKRRFGGVSAAAEQIKREDQKPYATHVEDYVAHLRLHARAERHIAAVKKCLLALAAEVGVGRLSEVTRDNVEAFLRALKAKGVPPRKRKAKQPDEKPPQAKGPPEPPPPLAARTLNYARNSLASFMAWAMESRRAGENPVTAIRRQSEADPTRKRRALTQDELRKLFEVTEPLGRRPYYATAYFAGLRRSEIKKLTWGDVDLERGVVVVREGKAKGRVDELPLHDELRAQLLATRPEKPHPATRVFATVPTNKARRKDFRLAGIVLLDDADRVADLHSLRSTLATDLARRGVAPQIAQKLLRHSTINLTMRHYTHLRLDDLAGGLGQLAIEPKQQRTAAAVGDGTGKASQWNRQYPLHDSARPSAARRDPDAPKAGSDDDCKSRQNQGLGGIMRRPATRRDQERAISSAGRAPALHAGGRRFEPCIAHHCGETRRYLVSDAPPRRLPARAET